MADGTAVGTAPTGPIQVWMASLDLATAPPEAAPGPSKGIRSSGGPPVNVTLFHAAEVTLTVDGSPAQLASGTEATLRLPLPGADAAGVGPGDVIPAWYYDLQAGMWREDGAGLVEWVPGQGLVWVAHVDHFTWWAPGTPIEDAQCLQVTARMEGSNELLAGAHVTATYYFAFIVAIELSAWTDANGVACIETPLGSPVHVSVKTEAGLVGETDWNGVGPAGTCDGAGDGCSEVEVLVPPSACVSGTALLPDGAPAGGARVVLSWKLYQPNWSTKSATGIADVNGNFCVPAPPGVDFGYGIYFADDLNQAPALWGYADYVATGADTTSSTTAQCGSTDGCTSLGQVTLGTIQGQSCGDPALQTGELCRISGSAGDLVFCPVCLATTSSLEDAAGALQAQLAYDPAAIQLQGMTTNLCFGTHCFVLPVIASLPVPGMPSSPYTLSAGHVVSPGKSVAAAQGELPFLVTQLSAPGKAISSSVLANGVGPATDDPEVMAVLFKLLVDIPGSAPTVSELTDLVAINAQGQVLTSYTDAGIVTTGTAQAEAPGTGTGCAAVLGDVDGNGNVIVTDVKCAILQSLAEFSGSSASCQAEANADVDCSGYADIVDVHVTTLVALSSPLPPILDANSDGCIDRCAP